MYSGRDQPSVVSSCHLSIGLPATESSGGFDRTIEIAKAIVRSLGSVLRPAAEEAVIVLAL